MQKNSAQKELKELNQVNIWIPNLFETKGGIQVYSHFLVKAIQSKSKITNYRIFVKHDSKSFNSHFSSSTKIICSGNIPLHLRTLAFSFKIFTDAIWHKPDLIITTHINFTPVSNFLKKLFGIPYWTVTHGIEAWNVKKTLLVKSLKNADRILSVSEYTKNRLIDNEHLDLQKILVLPNTFDQQKFQIAPKPDYLLKRHQLLTETKIILTVGRLSASEQYKGFDQVIRSLPQIIPIIPNVHYIIVGKGDDRPRIEQLIRKLNLESYVTLAGFIPDHELCDYYNLCDVFAMPSKGEGFGIVYLEAMACGKPCLGGNQDAALDALCQGELGVLVNPDDIDEIAQALIQVLQKTYPNPLLYQPEQLRQAVIDRFGFEVFQRRLQEYLDDFLTHSSLNKQRK